MPPGGARLTLTLGIETSCDETSVAVVENGRRILANVIHSQVELHKEFGGVVPELAARDHLERLPQLLDMAMGEAQVKPADLDLVAVTRGPGLVGCLLVGVGVGEGLAAAWSKPLTGVNHLWGHIYAAMLTRPELEPPLLGLVVSGAHSDLVRMPEARPHLRSSDGHATTPRVRLSTRRRACLAWATRADRRSTDSRAEATPNAGLCLGPRFLDSSTASAASRRRFSTGSATSATRPPTRTARTWPPPSSSRWWSPCSTSSTGPRRVAASDEVVVAGGVAANTLLRRRAAEVVEGRARLTMPPLELCTDNAAMIAAAGFHVSAQPADVDPSLSW